MVNDHAADFYSVTRRKSGQIERDAGVLNPTDFHDGAQAAVF